MSFLFINERCHTSLWGEHTPKVGAFREMETLLGELD